MSEDAYSENAAAGPLREAVVDLDAIEHNVRHLAGIVAPARVLVVVKADAYGHGALAVARAAERSGADWLGVADLDEALELRAAGIEAPVLAWLHDIDADYARGIDARIDLGVSSIAQLESIADAATAARATAHVHLKIDTGLSRNGVARDAWRAVVERAAALERAGAVRVRGIFSHLANAGAEADAAQLHAFDEALGAASAAGLAPELRHLASTEGALRRPETRFDLVRIGIGAYGIAPFGDGTTADELGLRPAMTVRARVAAVRGIAAGTGASYGLDWRAEHATTLALVPFGYADGMPRQASGRAQVYLAGALRSLVGRVAMDQFIVDVGDDPVEVGDVAVVVGDPARGEPSADDLAARADTIGYEIVTRIGPRVPRRYVGAVAGDDS